MSDQMTVGLGLSAAGTLATFGFSMASDNGSVIRAHQGRANAATQLLRDGPLELFGPNSETELRATVDEASAAVTKLTERSARFTKFAFVGAAMWLAGGVTAFSGTDDAASGD